MKKMRRMIPALCMLLVSAIMMSTASYAWFTMNNQVTATGMQVQAKSTGSLVVGSQPLGDIDKKTTTVKFNTTQQNLQPVTYIFGEGDQTGWLQAVGETVDPITGKAVTLVAADMANEVTYFDQEIYIGSAGDPLENQVLTINIASLVHAAEDIAYNAYAAAIYVYEKPEGEDLGVWANDAKPTATAEPLAVIRVAEWDNDTVEDGGLTNNTVALTKEGGAGYDIPSVVGLSTQDKFVGLKVVVRVFVDGNLKNYDKDQNAYKQVDIYKDAYALGEGTFDKENDNTTYYTRTGTSEQDYAYIPVVKAEMEDGADLSQYYVYVGQVVAGQDVQYCINSNYVPTAAASLNFTFSVSDAAPAQQG